MTVEKRAVGQPTNKKESDMEMLGRFGEMFDRLWEMIAGLGVFSRILSVVIQQFSVKDPTG